MSNFYLCLVLIAGFSTFAHCRHVPPHHEGHGHHPSAEDYVILPYMRIAPANAAFAFKLYHEVASEAAKKNILVSPLSISISLAMLSLGAQSSTLTQLLSGLCFNLTEINEQEIHEGFRDLIYRLNINDTELELNVEDALFIDQKWNPRPKFVADAKHSYQADILGVNFRNPKEAEEKVNSYIKKKTHGELEEVVKDLDPLSAMVLINTIFLQANWETPFSPENTRDEDFHVNTHTTVKVPMMSQVSYFKSYYDEDLSCQVVQLPYKGGASALFILPDPGKLKQVEDALGKEVLLSWANSLRRSFLHLRIPKVSFSSSSFFKGILRRMGILDIFSDHADLSGISREHGLKVSKAIHKAHLNVYENGTEAAATTVIDIDISTRHSPFEIKVDGPFLILIYHNLTGAILFLGKVINPNLL